MKRNQVRARRATPIVLALAFIIPEALFAVCKTPPAGAPPCRDQIPEWTQIEYDCVTGDHYSNSSACNGTLGKPALPQSRCDQPDILAPDANGVQLRCDRWDSDYYERPFAPGNSEIFPDQDLIYVLATQDDTWWYFLIQLYGLLAGSKLDAQYSVEIDADLDNPADYRPAGEASCNDWWMVSSSPSANIRDQVGQDQWGQNGVVAWYDATSNEPGLPGFDQGGCHCSRNDDTACANDWSGNGYDEPVDDQANGDWPNGLWAMIPSDCESIATSFIDPAEIARLGGGSFGPEDVQDGTCVILAVRKEMVADRRFDLQIPSTFGFRAWASKGQQDNQNVAMHDKYTRPESGDAYYDELEHPPSSLKEVDSSVKLLFGPCPAFQSAETRLLTQGQDQVFSPALAPPVRGGSPSSAFLSSFLPLPNQSRWPGSLLHFIRPIPFDENPPNSGNFFPDLTEVCSPPDTDIGCLAWDAGTAILNQSPTPAQVATDRMIGSGADQRRVTYSQAGSGSAIPWSIRKFDYPNTYDPAIEADEHDLWRGLGIPFVDGEPTEDPSEAAARGIAEGIIRETLQEITAPDPRNPSQNVTYVLGSSFHTPPRVLAAPERFDYLASNLEGNGRPCEDTVQPNRGYGCFFERHRRRRSVLIADSDDGQVHAFDAGRFAGSVVNGAIVGELDRGTGREIFAHIPRPMLQHTAEMTQVEFDFGLDGTPVVDDVFIDPRHNGTPTATEREWRTVLVGGYRHGARGYYALDITQPDHLDEETVNVPGGGTRIAFVPDRGANYVPSCSDIGSLYTVQDCGPNPYPSVLWEFTDDCVDPGPPPTPGPCDEDNNGHDDLGLTWSIPNTGRVRVQEGANTVIKYVAIFGGGLESTGEDLETEINNNVGNFLFMVDIETGKTLYKRPLLGAAPSEPAAVDTDGDAVLDTVYIGTAAGFLYKVDISQAGEINAASGRVEPLNGLGQPQWAPFVLFNTAGRPIFFPPQVVFVAQTGHFALGFGTGDRLNLFKEQSPAAGRFYMIVDQGFDAASVGVPFVEANFAGITLADANLGSNTNYLLSPPAGQRAGWVLQLNDHERLIGDGLFVAGAGVFSTYDPNTPVPACNAEGTGRLYSLLATNADALGATRSRSFEQFVTAPFAIPPGDQAEPGQPAPPSPFESPDMAAIRSSLMGLFPANCKFGNFSHQIAAQLSDTNTLAAAQVPVCVAVKNWKEF